MGPVMNLLLAVVLTAVVLYQGAEVPVVRGSAAGRRRRRRPDSPAAKAGIRPGDRIVVGRRTAASTPGRSSSSPSARGRIARSRSRSLRDGIEMTRQVTPADRRDEPVRDRRHRRAAERASASSGGRSPASRPSAPASRPATSSSPSTASRSRSARSCSDAIAKHPEQPITLTRPARRTARRIHGDARATRGDRRMARHRHRRRDQEHQARACSRRSA